MFKAAIAIFSASIYILIKRHGYKYGVRYKRNLKLKIWELLAGALMFTSMIMSYFISHINLLLAIIIYGIIWVLMCGCWYKRRLEERLLVMESIVDEYKDDPVNRKIAEIKILDQFDDRDEAILAMVAIAVMLVMIACVRK